MLSPKRPNYLQSNTRPSTSQAFIWQGEPFQFRSERRPHPRWFTDIAERIRFGEPDVPRVDEGMRSTKRDFWGIVGQMDLINLQKEHFISFVFFFSWRKARRSYLYRFLPDFWSLVSSYSIQPCIHLPSACKLCNICALNPNGALTCFYTHSGGGRVNPSSVP